MNHILYIPNNVYKVVAEIYIKMLDLYFIGKNPGFLEGYRAKGISYFTQI